MLWKPRGLLSAVQLHGVRLLSVGVEHVVIRGFRERLERDVSSAIYNNRAIIGFGRADCRELMVYLWLGKAVFYRWDWRNRKIYGRKSDANCGLGSRNFTIRIAMRR